MHMKQLMSNAWMQRLFVVLILAAVAKALDGLAVDWCLHPGAATRKHLLVCDLDSTIIGQECLDELADLAGVGDQVRAMTKAAMAGNLDFEEALRQRVRLLKGQPVSLLQRCFQERLSLSPGARTLVQTMARDGAMTALVSGGFTYFTSRIAKATGFAAHQANELISRNGKLTGEVGDPVLGRNAKAEALQHYCRKARTDAAQALAIGDGANDLAMIRAAGLGLGWRPRPVVAEAANGLIRHTALTTALFFQGMTRAEFAVPGWGGTPLCRGPGQRLKIAILVEDLDGALADRIKYPGKKINPARRPDQGQFFKIIPVGEAEPGVIKHGFGLPAGKVLAPFDQHPRLALFTDALFNRGNKHLFIIFGAQFTVYLEAQDRAFRRRCIGYHADLLACAAHVSTGV